MFLKKIRIRSEPINFRPLLLQIADLSPMCSRYKLTLVTHPGAAAPEPAAPVWPRGPSDISPLADPSLYFDPSSDGS